MALSKVNFNSMNVTPAASKAIKFNSDNDGLETGDIGGSLVLLSTQTASSSSTISFTSGIDSTYKEYLFKFINIHQATDDKYLGVQFDTGTNTNYNQTITSTTFRAYHDEADSGTALEYRTGNDQAQGTAFQNLMVSSGSNNDNDSGSCGFLHLFDPSNTTFVKHFIARMAFQTNSSAPYAFDTYVAGYVNTTTALTRVQFKFDSGNIDSGTIKMYGVK